MINALINVRAKLMRSQLVRRFLGGAAWSVIGSIVSSGITLIMLMLVARLLSKETYGQFIIIQSTLNMVGVFAGFGIGLASIRYTAALRVSDTARLGHILILAERSILGFGLFASIGLAFISGWMATYILNAPSLTVPLAISAGAVLFTALDSYQKSVLIGFESMRVLAIGTIIGVIAGFPIMLLATKYFGLQGAAVALVVNSFLQAGISRYQMTREFKKHKIHRRAKGCLNEWRVLWNFAFPALLSGALVGPAHWSVQALLANTPNGYAELAVLGIAMQWLNVIMFVPVTAARVVLPILTDHISKNDHGSSREILLYAMGANAILAVPMSVIIGILSPHIMSLYGISFIHDYTPLVLATITAALLAIQSPVGHLLAASSRMWLAALMNAGWAFAYIGLAYFLINKGATGIMLALGISYMFHAIWTFWYASRYINFTIAS